MNETRNPDATGDAPAPPSAANPTDPRDRISVIAPSAPPNSSTPLRVDKRLVLRNDKTVAEIRTGAKAFYCIGVSPPHDHPHIYLTMDGSGVLVCPYCSTRYRYDRGLSWSETEPMDCRFIAPAAIARA